MSAAAQAQLAAALPVGIYACDLRGRITFFNRRAAELWGREPRLNTDEQRYCGALRTLRIDGAPLPFDETPVARALARGHRFHDHELILEHPDGSRLACSLSVEPQYDPSGVLSGAVAVMQDITERKRAEELLSRQADLLAQTHDAIFAWQWNGTIVFWNRGAERLYGFSATEALGRKTFELLKFEAPRDFEALRQQLSREGQCTEELAQFTRDGRRVIVESRIVLSRSFDSQPVVLETNRDVTERKEFERALKESEERLRLAIDAGQIGTWDWDMVRNHVTWSNHVYDFHGLKPGEFDGRVETFAQLVHPEDRDAVTLAIRRSVETGEPYSIEMRVIRPDGSTGWIFTNGQVLFDTTRKPVRMLGATVEITQRKREIAEQQRAEAALRQSESEFRSLAESVPQMVWAARADGAMDYANQRWVNFTGLSVEQSRGIGWMTAVHPEDVSRTKKTWETAVVNGGLFEVETRFRRAPTSEYVWHIVRATPVRDASGTIVKWFGTCTDIESQKRAEEKLENAVRERTAKLRETVGELEAFSYSVSHDLRAPLRAMHGYSVALMEDAAHKLSAEQREYLDRISRGSQRLDRLINDVLTYSRLARTEVRFDPVNLDRVVREVIQQYPSLQPNRAEIRIQESLGVVLGHEALVVQIVSNLLINGAKFVAPGVFPKLRISSEVRGEWLRLWFEDNGIGIAPHNLSRVFGIFQRLNADSEYEGTGIGLSIVRKAVERLGGHVGVESKEGQGSRFWIELKRSE